MKEDLQKAIDTLKSGGIILYPTDTIWGIGCDANNDEAVKKIFKIKKREADKSLLVLVDSLETVCNYVEDIPSKAKEVVKNSHKPITVIYTKGKNVCEKAMADDGSLGIRVTNELFSHELTKQFGGAIISTSANFSGEPSPQNFLEISDELKSAVDYIVKFNQDDTTEREGSAIVKFNTDDSFFIIRK